jgi:hypothetical protein
MNSRFVFSAVAVLAASGLAVFKLPNVQLAQSLLYFTIFNSIIITAQAIYDDRMKISETKSRSLANPETTIEKILSFVLSPKIFGFIAPVVLGWLSLNTTDNVSAVTDGVQSLVGGDASKLITFVVGLLGVFINNLVKKKMPPVSEPTLPTGDGTNQ